MEDLKGWEDPTLVDFFITGLVWLLVGAGIMYVLAMILKRTAPHLTKGAIFIVIFILMGGVAIAAFEHLTGWNI